MAAVEVVEVAVAEVAVEVEALVEVVEAAVVRTYVCIYTNIYILCICIYIERPHLVSAPGRPWPSPQNR